MREILFRGKRKDNGEWVEGAYYKQTLYYGDPCEKHYIITSTESLCYDQVFEYYEVDPETVGQYTGLTEEKLMELLDSHCDYAGHVDCKEDCTKCLVDHLIAHGVTVQSVTDNNVGCKWISVKDRLPEDGERIIVCYDDGWVCDQCTPVDGGVTHWMPLPQPPKGE